MVICVSNHFQLSSNCHSRTMKFTDCFLSLLTVVSLFSITFLSVISLQVFMQSTCHISNNRSCTPVSQVNSM